MTRSDVFKAHFVDCSNAGAQARLTDQLRRCGLATVENLNERTALVDTVSLLGMVRAHRDSHTDGITTIAERSGSQPPGYKGFGAEALNPHTEGSTLARPPMLLALACQSVGESGGDSALVDGLAVYRYLAREHPEALRSFFTRRSALFGGESGYLGSIFEKSGQRVVLRLRLDSLVQFSPDVSPHLPALYEAIEATVFRIHLLPGDGYILVNNRWLHGRAQFVGQRVMLRLLADVLPGSPIPPGFDPQADLGSDGSRPPIAPRSDYARTHDRPPCPEKSG